MLLCSTLSSSSLSRRYQSSHQRCSIEKVVLKRFTIFTEKHLRKETPTHGFPCNYREILKNTYFEEHLRTAASANGFKTFHLECFDFIPNNLYLIQKAMTVCIIFIIRLSVKIKIKSWTIVSTTSQKYRMRRNLEVNQLKPIVSCSVFIGSFTK